MSKRVVPTFCFIDPAAIFKPPPPHPPPANDLATTATWARLNLQMLQGRLGFDVSSSNHTI